MDRMTFIQKTVGAMLVSLPVYTIIGCSNSDSGMGNDDPKPNPQGDCLANGTKSSIANNHGHTLTVSKSDVQGGIEKTYSIQGTSGHNHDVTLTANNFATLESNHSITVNSTTGDGHTHSVLVSCA
ncbi:hypothetical protein K8352_18985 [Flavobacteriaceae bacterium F89]|uniref:Uncharacterized protein n=1 Tax=Cerina litoralis TaxID=2874477 RepID=A0AAE3JR62_9FLAO|nr:hypothetical protein [Cerina litoralis]MCG2462856.1 hypothetical protein [Cerina litoralis]